jgi:hypothetical protein
MDECEYFESDFTDHSLQLIQSLLGPKVKDMLLLPGAVVINVPDPDKLG